MAEEGRSVVEAENGRALASPASLSGRRATDESGALTRVETGKQRRTDASCDSNSKTLSTIPGEEERAEVQITAQSKEHRERINSFL